MMRRSVSRSAGTVCAEVRDPVASPAPQHVIDQRVS
jgi:hypothetical protein